MLFKTTGRLSLELLDKTAPSSARYKAEVISFVYALVLWTVEPIQSIVDALYQGHRVGLKVGDFLSSSLNLHLTITYGYVAGQELRNVREKARDFIRVMMSKKNTAFTSGTILIHSHTVALMEGPQILDAGRVDDVPSESEELARTGKRSIMVLLIKLYRLTRAFLLEQLDDVLGEIHISDIIVEENHPINPVYLFGIFIEGLASFRLSRQSNDSEKAEWMKRGEAILSEMQRWNGHSSWNWESKMLLLEAEMNFSKGYLEEAAPLFMASVRSAHTHKLMNDEAICSELAGVYFYEKGLHESAYQLFMHSLQCYNKWGALALAKRVETDIQQKFGPDLIQTALSNDVLHDILASNGSSSKKRQG